MKPTYPRPFAYFYSDGIGRFQTTIWSLTSLKKVEMQITLEAYEIGSVIRLRSEEWACWNHSKRNRNTYILSWGLMFNVSSSIDCFLGLIFSAETEEDFHVYWTKVRCSLSQHCVFENAKHAGLLSKPHVMKLMQTTI